MANAIEYGLMATLISAAAIAGLTSSGRSLSNVFRLEECKPINVERDVGTNIYKGDLDCDGNLETFKVEDGQAYFLEINGEPVKNYLDNPKSLDKFLGR